MRLHGHDNENMKNNIKIQRMTYKKGIIINLLFPRLCFLK